MKIKAIIFSLAAVFGLQGSQYQEGTLPNAIQLVLGNKAFSNDIPVVFHGTHVYKDIIDFMNDQKIKSTMDTCHLRSVLLISDIGLQDVDDDKKNIVHKAIRGRKISRIELGERRYNDSFEFIGFADNGIEFVQKFDDHDKLIGNLKNYNFVIFNMRHSGMIGETNLYADEIVSLLNNNAHKTSILAIVGQEFNAINVEALCIKNGKNPIVFNKPKHPMIIFLTNNWKVITGGSLAILLFSLIYKIVR